MKKQIYRLSLSNLFNMLFYLGLKLKEKTLHNNAFTSTMLMDLSKAFNSINHELFTANLSAYKFSKDALKLTHSYMSYHWQRKTS